MSKVSQVNYAVVKRWCSNGRLEKLDAGVLAHFCYVLKCDLGEIMEFVPSPENTD